MLFVWLVKNNEELLFFIIFISGESGLKFEKITNNIIPKRYGIALDIAIFIGLSWQANIEKDKNIKNKIKGKV